MDKYRINLQLFAEGGAAAGGDGGAAAAAAGDTGVQAPDAGVRNNRRRHEDRLGNVKYSIQQEGVQQVAPAQEAAEEGTEARKSFRELIDGEYKDEANAYIQNIIQNRFPKNAENEARLESLKPLLDAVGKKFGVDSSDIEAMIDAVNYDEAELEEEAAMRGLSLESLKTVKELERKAAKLDRIEQQNAAQMRMQQHFNSLAQQAEAAKAAYPQFDLMKEMQNPTFARLTAPGVGIDPKTAYELVHKDEIAAAQAQAQAIGISKAIQANGARPAENGMKGAQGASTVKTDPRTFTREEREALRRLVESGKRVVLG